MGIASNQDKTPNITSKSDANPSRKFYLGVYGRKYEHMDYYRITWNDNGWYIDHISIGGQCDISGSPYLEDNFMQDYIPGSSSANRDFAALWAKVPSFTDDEVQDALNCIGKMASPPGKWVDLTQDQKAIYHRES